MRKRGPKRESVKDENNIEKRKSILKEDNGIDLEYLEAITEEAIYKILKLKEFIFQGSSKEENKEEKMADKIKIPVFNGRDYNIWKKRILLFLKWKNCDEAARREIAATDDRNTWEESNLKAMNYIYSGISNDQMEFVSDEETAYGIMQKFDKIYLKESTALQICVRNRLEKIKLKDYEDSSTFFTDFEKMINDLKNAGATVNEKEKLNYMLRTLPDSLSYIGDLIDAMQETDQTCEFIKNKITMWEIREKGENSQNQSKSSVFKTERRNQDKICFGCGKPGHLKVNCKNTWSRGNSGTSGAGRGTYWQGGDHQTQLQQHRSDGMRGRGGQRGYVQRSYGQRGYAQRGYGQRGYGQRGSSWLQRSDGNRQSDASQGNSENSRMGNAGLFYTEIESKSQHKVMNVEANSCEDNRIDWILDSGCTDHITNNDLYFTDYVNLKTPINVKVGDGRLLKATKIGNIQIYSIVHGNIKGIKMSNVFYVKEMDRNLISFAKVTGRNSVVSVGNTSEIYNEQNELIAIALKENGLYKMRSYINNKECNATTRSNENMTLKEKYHRILGHVNFKYLDIMCKNKLVDGIPNDLESELLRCGTCIKNKMHNLTFENKRRRAKDLLEIVHTDLNGPHNTTGYNGEKYFLSFIDDYSKAARIYTLKSKVEVYECFIDYINIVENMTGKRIKRLRCDNGKEYLNKDIFRLAREKGISLEPCPPYVHQLNGTAERYNRTIMDTARCLLSEAKVNNRFWPEVIKTASYLKNRTLANTLEIKTPFEILTGKKPNICNLRLYGSRVFVRVPEEKRKSKWDRKADLGILLGYDNVGYRILINNKVIVARHVDIIEENVNLIGFNGDSGENEAVSDSDDNDDSSAHEQLMQNTGMENESDEDKDRISNREVVQNPSNRLVHELRKSERIKKRPVRYGESSTYSSYIYVNFVSADSPISYEEAWNSSESDLWKQAMDREINCLKKNKTWKLVQKPRDKKILDLKWVFTNKSDNRKKARLVVRGFQQSEVLEDLYSPVAKMQTLKLLLSYCCHNGLMIMQMDVETAFLNGTIKSEVYVKQPIGYEDGTDRVCKLERALYGLRESPRAWYECFDKYVRELGFKKSGNDYCLYMKDHLNDRIYLIIFVDDLLICGKHEKELKSIKSRLSERFAMKDLGEVKTYLGINIGYDCKKHEMTLDQKDYIESLARKYNIKDAKLYHTPMEQNLKLKPAQSACNNIKFRNLIGALLYISTGTRLDVSHSVNYLSRFQNSYNETHYKYALRILKYLYLTKDLKLIYKRNENADVMDCFVDADWAGDEIDRKSTTGYIIRMYENVVYWKSRKQGSVTKSSTAAEYVALSESVSELKVMMDLLQDFKIQIEEPINVYEDNSGAVAIAKFGNFTKKSKYIEVHHHFVHEAYEKKIIDIVKIESENNIADILTKSLGRNKFEKFKTMLRLQ